MERNITIGRDSHSDIHIDERWDTVSNQHANIMLQDDMLIFYDHSTNGTIINGKKIHNTHASIYPGDKIQLAGVFELDWNVIDTFFPHLHRPTVIRNIHGGDTGRRTIQINPHSRETEPYNTGEPHNDNNGVNENYGQANTYTQADIDKALEKWNWGAFFCSWLWAVVHKIYWPLILLLLNFIPYIGQVSSLCICVYLGLKGSRLAWNSAKYDDFESYKRAQRNWAIGGIIWFIVSIAVSAFWLYYILSLI